jgi:hypothetical protein
MRELSARKTRAIRAILASASKQILQRDPQSYQAVVSVELARDTQPYIDLHEVTKNAPRLHGDAAA